MLPPETEEITFSGSPIHGVGAFAKRPLARGTRVIEYVGEKLSPGESFRRCEQQNVFIFALDDSTHLDGNVPWNPARFINHSCAPNCDALVQDGRLWLVANREIPPGEEITFNYGFDLEDYRHYPCRCGAPNCVGYIVAEVFFDHVRQQPSLTR